MSDPINQFKDAIHTSGMTPPDFIQADGNIHRFSTNGKPYFLIKRSLTYMTK
jgi:putative DNA primase/helicase